MDYIEQYRLWCQKVKDQELEAELVSMEGNISAIKDAFYRDLSFGTAGLRGELGVGNQSYEHIYGWKGFTGACRLSKKAV